MNRKKNNVFITDYIDNPRIEKEILGDHLCLNPNKKIEYLLVWHKKINKKVLNDFPNLKGIVRYGVGYDNIDLEVCKERNIAFCNTPDYGTDEVSNTTVSMIMDSSRKIFEYNQIAKNLNGSSWQENTIRNIRRNNELNVGIIGCGRIGSSVILKLNSLNFNTYFYDPYLNWGYEKIISSNRLYNVDDLLKKCDIVTIHCPLNKETDGMIDSTFLKKMKRGSILINTARGEIISDVDLIYSELKKGNIYSVYLDVLPDEPPDLSKKLIKEWRSNSSLSHRIIINPHTAYYSQESFEEMRLKASENILRMINNEPLLYRII